MNKNDMDRSFGDYLSEKYDDPNALSAEPTAEDMEDYLHVNPLTGEDRREREEEEPPF